jgi:diguanylate cyclase (GGDEF)-like protein
MRQERLRALERTGSSPDVPEQGDGLRAAYHRELRATARVDTLLACWIVIGISVAWLAVDRFLEPTRAHELYLIQAVSLVPVLALTVVAQWHPLGRAHALAIGWLTLGFAELGIAWMIPRVEHSLPVYALAFALPLQSVALGMRWPAKLTIGFIAVAAAEVAAAYVVYPGNWNLHNGFTIGAYVLGSLVVAGAASVHRYRLGLQEFATRRSLLQERRRGESLLEELRRLSSEDDLTGLANRRQWNEELEREFARVRRYGGELTVLVIDVDRFKDINDNLGHAAGDRVLQALAASIKDRVRSTDCAARLGGDELAVLCPGVDLAGGLGLARDLLESARALRFPRHPRWRVTMSIGVASLTDPYSSGDDLLRTADTQLYGAKRTRDLALGVDTDTVRIRRAG